MQQETVTTKHLSGDDLRAYQRFYSLLADVLISISVSEQSELEQAA